MYIDDNSIILVLGYATTFAIGAATAWGLLYYYWRL